jgi:hypothetical protein
MIPGTHQSDHESPLESCIAELKIQYPQMTKPMADASSILRLSILMTNGLSPNSTATIMPDSQPPARLAIRNNNTAEILEMATLINRVA